jgi:hypothetical protein
VKKLIEEGKRAARAAMQPPAGEGPQEGAAPTPPPASEPAGQGQGNE